MSDNIYPNDTVPSQVVPGLLSPRPGASLEDAQNFDFLSYVDNGGHYSETEIENMIHRTESDNNGNGSIHSGSNTMQQRHKRRRHEGSTYANRTRSLHDSDKAIQSDDKTNDHFLSVIQEQIPHLEGPVSQRKRSSSISSRTEHAPGQSPPELSHPPSSRAASPPNTVITARQFVPAAERSDSPPKILKRLKSQHHSGPKRPRTAYIIFLEHFRQQYNEKFPNANFNECQKLAGKKWRSLSAVEKQPWKDQERISQKDFIHKMHGLQTSFGLVDAAPLMSSSTYGGKNSKSKSSPHAQQSSHSSLQHPQEGGNGMEPSSSSSSTSFSSSFSSSSLNIVPGLQSQAQNQEQDIAENDAQVSIATHQNQMKKILDATVPNKMNELLKGPKNAFSMFVQSMREECQKRDPKLSYNEIQRQLSVEWRQMHPDDKQIWTDKANEVKRQLAAYNASLAAQGVDGDSNKKGDMRRVKKGIALPKGPRSAYTLFYQCARKQLHALRPQLSFQEYPTICSQIWRDMPPEEKILWKTDSINDKKRYEKELLVLARSEVANTATSIVMEENMEKRNRSLGLDSEALGHILSTHMASNSSGSGGGGLGSSSSDGASVSVGTGVPAPRKKRGKYKKRKPAESVSSLSGSKDSTTSSVEPHILLDNANSIAAGETSSSTTVDMFMAPHASLSSNSSSSVSSNDAFSKRVASSSSLFGREHGSLGILEYPHSMEEHDGEAWIDFSFSNDNSRARSIDDGTENGLLGKDMGGSIGGGAENRARNGNESVLDSFGRDSLDRQDRRLSPAPMAGIGKHSLLKSPKLTRGEQDFAAAGMTAKLGDVDEDDELRLDKSFSMSPPHTHNSSDKEREGDGGLYDSLHRSSSDSNHNHNHDHHHLGGDSDTLMPFSTFGDFRAI